MLISEDPPTISNKSTGEKVTNPLTFTNKLLKEHFKSICKNQLTGKGGLTVKGTTAERNIVTLV